MGWAAPYIARLLKGETVTFRPRGNSMSPRIRSGEKVTVSPIRDEDFDRVGGVVLCTVRGKDYLHFMVGVRGDMCQIANNHGHSNGWTSKLRVYGRLVE